MVTAAVEKTIASPDVSQQLLQLDAAPATKTPEAFAEFAKEEFARYGKLIREAGIRLE